MKSSPPSTLDDAFRAWQGDSCSLPSRDYAVRAKYGDLQAD